MRKTWTDQAWEDYLLWHTLKYSEMAGWGKATY